MELGQEHELVALKRAQPAAMCMAYPRTAFGLGVHPGELVEERNLHGSGPFPGLWLPPLLAVHKLLGADPTLDEAQLSGRLDTIAFDFIGKHPVYLAQVAYWNTVRLLDLSGIGFERLAAQAETCAPWLAQISVYAFWLLALLALAGSARRLGGLAPGSAGRQADSSGAKVHAASRSTITAHMSQRALVLGGGLTGLACAYELALAGVEVTVLEREQHPGGMASSFIQDGAGGGDEGGPGGADGEYWSYDFGPHRFHTTDPELFEHVQLILDGNCRKAHPLSRILLFGKFFDYPLQAGNVLRNLPRRILVKSFLDYFWVRFTERTGLSHHSDENFEGWVLKRFGRTLYEVFFGRYTGKSCP